MNILLWPILWAGLGCASVSYQAGPREELSQAIGKVRAQSSMSIQYKAKIELPNSDPMILEGTSLWVKPGVLYVQYKATGGDYKSILRVGEKVWIYHELLEDWVTAEEMGNQGAGRGVQNPDGVLGVIQKYAKNIKSGKDQKEGSREERSYKVHMTGPEIEKIMKEQTNQGDFDWEKSSVKATLLVDKSDGLIYNFSSVADLISSDPNVKGKVRYSADVKVTSYAKETSYTFKDSAGKALPLSAAIQKEIESFKKAEPGPKK